MKEANEELRRQRDTKIWLLHRGDNLTLTQISKIFSLHHETIRQRIHIIDHRMTHRWTAGFLKGPTPNWARRLLLANALVPPPHSLSNSSSYDAFESTAPEKK